MQFANLYKSNPGADHHDHGRESQFSQLADSWSNGQYYHESVAIPISRDLATLYEFMPILYIPHTK